jgi:RecA-family ATPase
VVEGDHYQWGDDADIPQRGYSMPLDALDDDVMPLGPKGYELARAKAVSLPELPFLDLPYLAKLPVPPREWAVDGFMPLGKATMLTGKGGVGKSLLAQLLCTCIAFGRPFLGLKVRQMPALYASWEDDHDELWRRQSTICASLGLDLAACHGARLDLISMADQPATVLFTIGETGLGIPTPRGEQFADLIDMNGGLFVLDNASHVYAGDHDKLGEVAAFAHWLNRLAKPTVNSIDQGPRAGLLLHHPNKAGADWLGSVAYENQFRSRLYMDRPEGNDLDLRRLSNPKANYSRTGGEVVFRWHEGSFVRDEDLSDEHLLEIQRVAEMGRDNDIFLACLAERTRQRRAVSEKTGRNLAPVVFATMPEARGVSKARLDAAMDRLFRLGRIERAELWQGPDRKPVFGLREVAE